MLIFQHIFATFVRRRRFEARGRRMLEPLPRLRLARDDRSIESSHQLDHVSRPWRSDPGLDLDGILVDAVPDFTKARGDNYSDTGGSRRRLRPAECTNV
jgi:hypothetical protein